VIQRSNIDAPTLRERRRAQIVLHRKPPHPLACARVQCQQRAARGPFRIGGDVKPSTRQRRCAAHVALDLTRPHVAALRIQRHDPPWLSPKLAAVRGDDDGAHPPPFLQQYRRSRDERPRFRNRTTPHRLPVTRIQARERPIARRCIDPRLGDDRRGQHRPTQRRAPAFRAIRQIQRDERALPRADAARSHAHDECIAAQGRATFHRQAEALLPQHAAVIQRQRRNAAIR